MGEATLYCDLLFGYSTRREYIGNLNFRNITTMQVEHVFSALDSVPGEIFSPPPLYVGAYTGVVVAGVNFGTGRIISFSNPTSSAVSENGRHLWKQNVTLETYESGDSSNIGADLGLSGLSLGYTGLLQGFDENFSFNLSQNGDYQFSRTATIKCIDDPVSLVSGYIAARGIASGLLAGKPPLGYINSLYSGYYTAPGKRLLNETVNVFDGSASFEEKFVVQSKNFIKHALSFEGGFANVSESATLRASGFYTANDVFSGDSPQIIPRFDSLLSESFGRCDSLYTYYRNSMGGTDAYTTGLFNQATTLTKMYDERSQEFTYSVAYTNNPNMTISGYTVEREQSLTLNNLGIVEALESATLNAYNSKSAALKGLLITGIRNESSGAKARLAVYSSDITNYKQLSDTKAFSIRGKRASYSISYTNDPHLINDGVFLSKTLNTRDETPILMHTPYFIIGRANPLMHNPMQTQMGTASCTINSVLVRPTGYYAATPVKPSSALANLFTQALSSLLSLISVKTPTDIFVSKVNYTYNSNMTSDLTVEAKYLFAKQSNT